VLQVRHLLPELPRVDLIVVLVGVNDLSNRLARDTEYAPDIGPVPSTLERLVRAFDVLPRFDDPTLSFIKRTRLWFFLTKVRYLFAGRNTVQDRAGEVYIEHRRLRHDAPEFRSALPDLTPALEEYRHRLELILAEARTHNTPILFVTQPTLWRADLTAEESSRLWFGWAGDRWGKEPVPYYTPAALAKGLSLYNETLMTFCRSQHVPCLDLAARMPSDARWFYDDVHFSEEGSSRVADILANEVARLTHPSDLPSTFPVP
jgi:lysophospholipase L1-like esterase